MIDDSENTHSLELFLSVGRFLDFGLDFRWSLLGCLLIPNLNATKMNGRTVSRLENYNV